MSNKFGKKYIFPIYFLIIFFPKLIRHQLLLHTFLHDALPIFLDEPTRGIDIGAKTEIYTLMRELSNRGVAIIMISSELPEILGMCDRIAVMRSRRIVTFLNKEQANQESIMRYAAGGVDVE